MNQDSYKLSVKMSIRFVVVFWILFIVQSEAQAAGKQQLKGHVPRAATNAPRAGDMGPNEKLKLAIGLPLRNEDQLQLLLQQLYDPHSPQYHQFLTPQQFSEKFGPTEKDYRALIDFAKSRGFLVTGIHSNRALLDVQGTVENVQKTFYIKMHYYKRPDGSRFHAPENEPSVDLDVPLLHITGLDDYETPKTLFKKFSNKGVNIKFLAGSGTNGIYQGMDFRNAYVPCDPLLTGAGQTIGIVAVDGYYQNDVKNYETQTGLPNNAPITVLCGGFNGVPSGGEGVTEASLDIEMAVAMAPSSKVCVYESSQTTAGLDSVFSNLASPPNNAPPALQISCSINFALDSNITSSLNQFAAQGQSFFLASGDSGAYPFDPGDNRDGPYTTLVGGTELSMSGNGASYLLETTWNDPTNATGAKGASGGGILTSVTIPSYQITLPMGVNDGSNSSRNAPDVSMVADNIFCIANNGNSVATGGTSASTPLWAGFMALVNQQKKSPVGFANPALYNIAAGPNYGTDFNDINDNSNNGSPTAYPAVTGYDLATGLGSPQCNLINDLAPTPVPTKTYTPIPPTKTPTPIPVSPTNTFTFTNTFTTTFTPTITFTSTNTFTPNPNTYTPTPTFTFTSTPTSTITVTGCSGGAPSISWDTSAGLIGGTAAVFAPSGSGPLMWEIEGGGSNANFNGVFSSGDGVNWTKVSQQYQPSFMTNRLEEGVLAFNGNLWVMGGEGPEGINFSLSDVYKSPDGANWSNVTNSAGFGNRTRFNATVFNGNMYIVGGYMNGANLTNEVNWSSDGSNWSGASAAFPARSNPGLVSFNGKLWVIGGMGVHTYDVFDDIWASPDGTNWSQVTPIGPYFSSRVGPSLVVDYNGLWLWGGQQSGATDSNVWFTQDGVHWVPEGGAQGSSYEMNALFYANKIWTGGANASVCLLPSIWRVVAGRASSYLDSQGNTWSADGNYSGGNTNSNNHAISGALPSSITDQALYQSERWGDSTYTFNVGPGQYQVTLKFAELFASGTGQRVFNVTINNTPLLSNFDIVADANGEFVADDKIFDNITPNSNNQIVIHFANGSANAPKISAIQIIPEPTPSSTWRIAAGSNVPITDSQNNVWSPDHYAFGTNLNQNHWPNNTITGAGIQGPADQALYQTERWAGAVTYALPVPPGNYQVRLKFAETAFSSAGQRVMNVSLNNTPVLTNFDIFADVGGQNISDDKIFDNVAPNSNGQILVQFAAVQSAARIDAIQIIPEPTPPSTWRVVAGSNIPITDSQNNVWAADQRAYGTGLAKNHWTNTITGMAIQGPADQALYQTERYAGAVTYAFPVPAGNYQVKLKFVETAYSSAGQRVMNVALNNTSVLTNFDIFANAGGQNIADDKTFDNVSPAVNGQILVQLSGVTGAAKIDAIQIIPEPPSTVRVVAGEPVGFSYTDCKNNTWTGDTGYYSGSIGTGSKTNSITKALPCSSDQTLYQSERYGTMTYSFNVPSGNYQVTLKFAEIFDSAANLRKFNVAINGNQVLSNFDVFADAGGEFIADDKVYNVRANSGQISIQLTNVLDNAKISSIQIAPQSPGPIKAPGQTTAGAEEGVIATPSATATISPTPMPSTRASFGVVAAPNVSRDGESVKFLVNLDGPAKVDLTLFTITGEKVYEVSQEGNAGLNSLTWNLQNQVGAQVASGLYLYEVRIEEGGSTRIQNGKVVVIR